MRAIKPVISYMRVSTDRQGRSGLGLEAQRETIARFAQVEGLEVVGEFVEVETGKGHDALDRCPKLVAALEAARKANSSILVAKLDRLSRDVTLHIGAHGSQGPVCRCPFLLRR